MFATVTVILYILALGYAAVRDLTSFEIPNWVALAIVADFIALAIVGSADIAVIGQHLSAGVAVLTVGAVLFYAGIIGGGDAKLLAACAVWVGWSGLLKLCLFVAVIGGVVALLLCVARRLRLPASWSERTWLERLHSSEQGIPYGVAIALGGIFATRDLPLVGEAVNGVIAPLVGALSLAAFV